MRTATVPTEAGSVRGIVENGVAAFRGIPYAADPIGALRFTAPAAAPPWIGVRDASRPGPSAPQGPSRLEAVMGARTPDWNEAGCLTVNVWSPRPGDGSVDGRPVLLWFHGGGFTSGSGGWNWYDGARLAAAGDIVVVTANYRLGPLGYLYLPELGIDNLGVRDQALALDWVVRNIGAFGGDPARVTLGGQSAGAYSALYLGLSPTTGPGVTGVIAQSGPFGLPPQDPDEARAHAARFLALAGIDDATPEALGAPPAAQLLDAYRALAGEVSRGVAPPMYPVLGGFGTERAWPAAVADGALAGRALLTGTTRDEMAAFLAFPPQAGTRDRAAEAAATTTVFGAQTIALAESHTAAGDTAFVYRFDRAPEPDPSALGAAHCADLPFAFDALKTYAGSPMLGPVDRRDRDLARGFCRALAGFIADARPADDAWTAYHAGDPATVRVVDRR
ncbi:carboxylesterase family protein [Tsukamurella ocularis]|uniref:carboxylesterase family protein n=1 Tax=Tsukamurella ocularis TaxID=1970234 RepID=UPI002168F9BB|nr:carboxylesterase family protein [Tsukamurella ocularis]